MDKPYLKKRRNPSLDITKILLGDLWGLDNNSIRMVIRGHGDVNRFCLVSVLSGEIVKQPCTGEELRAYLDGDNKFKQKFQFFGQAKDFFSALIDAEVREQMADLVVFKLPNQKETP